MNLFVIIIHQNINAKIVKAHQFVFITNRNISVKTVEEKEFANIINGKIVVKIVEEKGICKHNKRKDRCKDCKAEPKEIKL